MTLDRVIADAQRWMFLFILGYAPLPRLHAARDYRDAKPVQRSARGCLARDLCVLVILGLSKDWQPATTTA